MEVDDDGNVENPKGGAGKCRVLRGEDRYITIFGGKWCMPTRVSSSISS